MAQLREALTQQVGQGGADAQRLSDELFAVVTLFTAHGSLRRALSDPGLGADAKVRLVDNLLGGKVGDPTLELVRLTARTRWSEPRDVVDALEATAVDAALTRAENDGQLDEVEDELFRFERIVAADPALRAALSDTQAPADKRGDLVSSLLREKVTPETLVLARQAVVAPRGRRFDRVVERYLETASSRREQQTAIVTSAVPLTDDDRARLAAGLAALYGGTVHVNTVVDPRVLGGVKVEIGDEVIDGTVIRKLDAARRAMGA